MTEPNKEATMTRVMRLLALAADENATPAERALAEANAEKIMAKHMIDRFEASERAKRGDTEARKPIQTEWDIMMSEVQSKGEEYSSEFDHALLTMLFHTLEHCNLRVNKSYKYIPGGRRYQIVGFQEDIMYAERIWFNVFKAFVNNVNPQWSPTASLEENAYTFASAGVSWKNQVLLAEAAGDDRIEWPWRDQLGRAIDPGNVPWGRSIHKLKRACKKHADTNGLPYPYAGGTALRVATRNNFAQSYNSTICLRLDNIRREAKQSVADTGEKYAVALLDTRERVDAEFYRLYPQYDPDIIRKQREERDFLRAAEFAALSKEEQQRLIDEEAKDYERLVKSANRKRRSYRAIREDPRGRYDAAAWARGQKAAKSVNLRNDGEVKNTNKKEIN